MKQEFEIRIPNTDKIIWTNGIRKWGTENPGNWIPLRFTSAIKANKFLAKVPRPYIVMGVQP